MSHPIIKREWSPTPSTCLPVWHNRFEMGVLCSKPTPQPNTRRRHRCDSWMEPSPLVQCLSHWGRVRIDGPNQDCPSVSCCGPSRLTTHVTSVCTILTGMTNMGHELKRSHQSLSAYSRYLRCHSYIVQASKISDKLSI